MKQKILIERLGYRLKIIFFFIFYAFGITLNGQVTVGSTESPISGASLQLKEIEGVSDGSANSYKGFCLPRVDLTDLNNLFPMFLSDPTDNTSAAISEYLTNKAAIDAEHTGLLVMNIGKTNTKIKPGVYYWNGSSWQKTLSGSDSNSGFSSVYANVKIITGDYSPSDPYIVQDDDAILVLRMNRVPNAPVASYIGYYNATDIAASYPYINSKAALQLPDPTTCPGRVIRIINDSHRLGPEKYSTVFTNYPMYAYDSDASYMYTSVSRPNSPAYMLNSVGGNGSQWTLMSNGSQWFSLTVVIQ